MSRDDRMVVVVPCYNEARRLDAGAFTRFVAGRADVDLCLVDDGSTDTTAAILATLVADAPGRIHLLRQSRNAGKAEAVRTGLRWAVAEGYPLGGYLDADLAAPLESMVLLREELQRFPEVVLAIGSRVKLLGWRITRSERRHYLGRVFATCASLALGLPVYDTQCGAKLLRLEAAAGALAAPFLSRWLFDVELIARLRDAVGAARLREVPLPVWEDPGGSTLGLGDFVKAPLELWRIWRRYPGRHDA